MTEWKVTKNFFFLTKKICEISNQKKKKLTTKMGVLIIKMSDHKMEPVLTMKIVDNFVHFGMP